MLGMIGTSCAVGTVKRCGEATTSGKVFRNRKAAKRKATREGFLFVLYTMSNRRASLRANDARVFREKKRRGVVCEVSGV
jgi:hypothetical protein